MEGLLSDGFAVTTEGPDTVGEDDDAKEARWGASKRGEGAGYPGGLKGHTGRKGKNPVGNCDKGRIGGGAQSKRSPPMKKSCTLPTPL